MKQLTCEMCGGTDLMKQDGAFVCQNCGMKYSVEEAKKMMIEGTVDVQGTVKLDIGDELKNLYLAARNSMEASDYNSAIKHYEAISSKDPNSWEAMFYLAICKTKSIKNGEIASSAANVVNCLPKVFELLKTSVLDEKEQEKHVGEVASSCMLTANSLTQSSAAFYEALTKGNGALMLGGIGGIAAGVSSTSSALSEDKERRYIIANIALVCGNEIEKLFNMEIETYKTWATACWEAVILFDNGCKSAHTKLSYIFEPSFINELASKIKKYNPSFEIPEPEKSGGCYVATAVYGSYDCPQVWTLRRYRDYTLAETWYGRVFIRTYYAISPTLVKWFGDTKWFKKMWQGKLDRMVSKLNSNGVEDSPYEDKEW